MKSPIKKLLVSINQSNLGNLICFYYRIFDRAKEVNSFATKSRRLRLQILSFLYFSSFIFNENQVIIKEDNPSQKVVIVEEELDDIDLDGIGNLEYIPRLVFIDEECGNPKVIN